MQNIDKKASILRAVASGKTLKEAGAEAGIGAEQAVNHLSRICRALDLRYDLAAIRSNPDYLSRLDALLSKPSMGLRNQLTMKLVETLKLPDDASLTPQYMSNLSACDLYRNGITTVAIVEIQDWLNGYDLSLRKVAPESDDEIREVRRAIVLLNAFYFDTTNLEVQFDHLTGKDDEEPHDLSTDEEPAES